MQESGRIIFHFCRSLAVFKLELIDIVRSLVLPIVIGIITTLAVGETSSTFVRFTTFALLSLAFVIGALQLHRLVLFGPESIGLKFIQHNFRYVIHYIRNVLIVVGLATIFTLPLAILTADDPKAPYSALQASVVYYTLLLFWSYIFTRFSMLFVALAADESIHLKLAWRVTAQFFWLVIYMAALVPLLVLIDSIVLEPLLILTNCHHTCASLANKLFFTAGFSLVIINLTLAYETIRENSAFYLRNPSSESRDVKV